MNKNEWIPQNVYSDLFTGDIDYITLRAIVKYGKHSSILVTKKKLKSQKLFSFSHLTFEEVSKEMK